MSRSDASGDVGETGRVADADDAVDSGDHDSDGHDGDHNSDGRDRDHDSDRRGRRDGRGAVDGDAGGSGDAPRRVEVYPGREAVVEFDPGLTFECVEGCTWCCHHGVLLYGQDFRELAEHADLSEATTRVRGEPFVRREGNDHAHAAEDGAACYFLREDGLCELQAEHDWKPTRCSVFPLEVCRRDGDLHVSVRGDAREHCEGLGASDRRVVDHLDAFLPELLWELDDPDTRREL